MKVKAHTNPLPLYYDEEFRRMVLARHTAMKRIFELHGELLASDYRIECDCMQTMMKLFEKKE